MNCKTYVVGDVHDGTNGTIVVPVTGDHQCVVLLVDLDVDPVCLAKCHDLHVISVGASLGHLGKVCLENAVDLLLGGENAIVRGCV